MDWIHLRAIDLQTPHPNPLANCLPRGVEKGFSRDAWIIALAAVVAAL